MTLPLKTIWIFNHYAVTPDLPGGTRHFDLGSELARRGWQTVIFASACPQKIKQTNKISGSRKWQLEQFGKVSFVWLRTFPYERNNWRRLIDLLLYSYRAYLVGRKITARQPEIKPPQAIIGSTVHPLAVFAAYRLARKYRCPLIMEIRDLWPQTLIDMGSLSARHPLAAGLYYLEKFLLKRASRIIILSPRTKEYLVARDIPAAKILLIPNGADLQRYQLVTPARYHRPHIFKILYTGSFNSINSLDIVVQAAQLLQKSDTKIHLELWGDGPERLRLQDLAASLQLKNLSFKAPVPKHDIPRVLATADALLLIENKVLYGSSNKLADYLAAGRPIIFCTYAFHNTLVPAGGFAAIPGDASSLAATIIQLTRTAPEKLLIMGKHCQAYAAEKLAIPILVDKLENTLISL